MHFEILAEDRSGALVIEKIIYNFAQAYFQNFDIVIRPHRGKGELPLNEKDRPLVGQNGLLNLLPAKLRAYDRVWAGLDYILIIVLDSDDSSPEKIHQRLKVLCNTHAPSLRWVIGICVEEIESWLLGDKNAIQKAYPEAHMKILNTYKQDSICGTWEVLAKIILGDKARHIIKIGYPAIGQYKYEWADKISDHLNINYNQSPSFHKFYSDLKYVMLKKFKNDFKNPLQ